MTKVTMNTNKGSIKLLLNDEKAPITVKNFISYAEKGHYNNTLFHRVINDFMIQGGGLTTDMQTKECDSPIQNEADNGLKNNIGTIAMARTGDPHSATSQFFINVADNHFLNFSAKNMSGWGYCVFGEVTEGMDIVNNIKKVDTTTHISGHQDVPVDNIVINSITIG
jgi:peptidyl-prolyl cis-trans isomerase B (cyclophilin B)